MVLALGSTFEKILRIGTNEKLESNCKKNLLIIPNRKKKWKAMPRTVKNI
jgi:hypothetical protein